MSNTDTVKRDIYQEVTDRIIADLESGTASWVQPWSPKANGLRPGMPYNAASGRLYSGTNVLLLWGEAIRCGYLTQAWLTYRQAQEAGGHVRKGERGTHIVFTKTMVSRDKDSDETRTFPMLRYFTVFNVAQCDGLPERMLAQPAVRSEPEGIAHAEGFISATGAKIEHGHGKACYVPFRDEIRMPFRSDFKTLPHYYATALHELTHWTGHGSRCAREFGRRFGDHAYACEELVAELGAAFMCARLGIEGRLQHSEYIASWLTALRGDKRFVFAAASKATAAVDFLFERAGEYVPVMPSAEVVPLRPADPTPVNPEPVRVKRRTARYGWSLATVKRKATLPVPCAEALFADGVRVRWSFYNVKGEAIDWDRVRAQVERSYRFQAVPFPRHYPDHDRNTRKWESLLAAVRVPSLVSLHEVHTGETHIGFADAAE